MPSAETNKKSKNRDSTKPQTPAAPETVWVFEASPGSPDVRGSEEVAIQCHGATRGSDSGPAGSSYALVTRDDDNRLLPIELIKQRVEVFFDVAQRHGGRKFRIVVSPYRKTEQEHHAFADLFRDAPENCLLPGTWLLHFGRIKTARVIVLDAMIKAADSQKRKRLLDHYFNLNEVLWPTSGVEIVSFGLAHTIVQNNEYARSREYGHYVPTTNPKRYRSYENLAKQLLAMSYATRLVSFSDPRSTSTSNHMVTLQYAAAANLELDEVELSEDS